MRLLEALALACALTLVSSNALAASPEMLKVFEEGRTLAKAGDYEAASRKFLEAHMLEPSVGALLNLGDCYEKMGRFASARTRFLEAVKLAGATDPTRANEARARATKLDAQIAWIDFTHATTSAVKVTIGGEVVAPGTERVAVDPGSHEVVVNGATGERRTVVRVGAGESSAPVDVDLPAKKEKPGPSSSPPANNAPPNPDNPRSYTWISETWSGAQWAYVGTGITGLMGITLGVIAGGIADGKKSELDTMCPDYPRCPESRRNDVQSTYDDASTAATVSTIAFIAGAALFVGGSTLFVLSLSNDKRSAVVPTSKGVVVRF